MSVLTTIISVLIAIAGGYGLFRVGISVMRTLSTPLPEPPPAGELRKVKIMYRCSICGSEVRMTVATEQDPEAPRHCMAEMDLVPATE